MKFNKSKILEIVRKQLAIAGASADSNLMWQIGIDVLPQFRNKELVTSLVSNLAIMIMELLHPI